MRPRMKALFFAAAITLLPLAGCTSKPAASTINEQAALTLFDALGRAVWQQTAQPQELSKGIVLNMREMNEGVYFLSVRTPSGSKVMKVVKY